MSQSLQRNRHRPAVRKLAFDVDLLDLFENRIQRLDVARPAKGNNNAVKLAHRRPELSHPLVVPALIPGARTDLGRKSPGNRRLSQHAENMGVGHPALTCLGTPVGSQQMRHGVFRLGENNIQAVEVVDHPLDGLGDLVLGQWERILVLQNALRQIALFDEVLLQLLKVDISHIFSAFGRHRRRDPCGISLVLDVRLHTYDRHRVTMSAYNESRNQNAVKALRHQAAIRHVDKHFLSVGRPDREHRMLCKAVRVEIASRNHDCIGIRSPRRDIHRRHCELADYSPALARVDQLPQIVGVLVFFLGDDERTPDIQDVAVVDERPVGVGVAGPEP